MPALGRIAWRYRTGGTVRSSPILVDSTLYVGSSDGALYALAASDGSARWSFDTGGPIGSAPAARGGTVYVANREHTLFALDRASGRERWRVETGPDLPLAWGWEGWDYFTSSPTLADSLLLFASGDGTLYALDPETGAERWRVETERRFRATPAVSGGVVYLGGGDGIFRALDLATGRERWRFETKGATMSAADFGFDRTQIQSSAAVLDGTVYFGSRDASLYALDAATGTERWSFVDGSSWVSASPAVTQSLVVSARSSSTRVRALDRTSGEVRWMVTTGALVLTSPVVAGETVYVGNGGGTLFALDLATGAERWRLRLGYGIYGTPVVAEGRIYLGDDDGMVYAIETTTAPPPRRAVYWDERHAKSSILGSQSSHRAIVDYLTQWGYREVDADGALALMDSSRADGAPSVVVFAMDYLPPLLAGAETETGPFRRYLDAGGKVVWLGFSPLFLKLDPETRGLIDSDRERPARLLGVDHSRLDTDTYQVRPTDAGRRVGLEEWWRGSPSVAADAPTEVLALDELGRAAAWVQRYGGPLGTGFVYLPIRDPARAREIREVADYGIIRAP
ncbi:MAG: PQQ-binding-like beta-propeller repeat protein [Gemmatimonadales bacterium]